MNEDVYQTVASYFPNNNEAMAAFDPEVLLHQIETRLVTADQLEYKWLRFELARQEPDKNPWKFENRLLSLYRSAQINDEEQFVEIFKKGIHNNELRKMLLLHKPAINTIESLKEAVQGIQTGLLKYARTLTNPPASATAGLGSLQREEFDHRKKQ